jgi:hypothetical protein
VAAAVVDLQCGTCGATKGSVGKAYSAAYAVVGGTGPYTYSIVSGSLPAGLSLSSSTGTISGTPTVAGTYTFTAKVVDSKGKSDTTTCTLTIQPPPITADCGPCSASKATVGTAYSAVMTATGGAGGYTWSITSGSLPPGLTLNTATGRISGTPILGGTYTFTAKATDSQGNSDTDTCTITVNAPPVNLTCGSCGSSKIPAGSAVTSQLQISGGSGSYSFSLVSGSLPPGLTLNSGTGVISGTPTTAGTYTFTSKVVDSLGSSDTATCTMVVTQTITAGVYTTYTQGGWGASPSGNNPGMVLAKNFSTVYPAGSLTIGGTYKLTFTSAGAIANFLPQGGSAGALTGSAINSGSSNAGVFAGQVLALQLSVDFSNKGITHTGLAALTVTSGAMKGYTVAQVLAIANAVIGGSSAALPSGVSLSTLNSVVDAINNNFDNGVSNNGYLQ